MPAQCWSTLRSCCARFTRVDGCGSPVFGPDNQVVTKGHISIAYAPNITEGEEIEVKNACGEVCVSDKACDTVKWIDITGTFCQVDPDLFSLLTSYPRVFDADGNSNGIKVGGKIECNAGFALETWTEIPQKRCVAGQQGQWGYFLAPYNTQGVIQDWTIQNGELTFSFKWRAVSGSLWGAGPYDVDNNAPAPGFDPGPLVTPITADDMIDMHLTSVAPPCIGQDAQLCGFQPVVAPALVA